MTPEQQLIGQGEGPIFAGHVLTDIYIQEGRKASGVGMSNI
jgi:hypothetical protein